jgi:hypothetical protein
MPINALAPLGEQLGGLPSDTRGGSGHQHTLILQFHDDSNVRRS